MIKFFLRTPTFPILIEGDDGVSCALDAAELSKVVTDGVFVEKSNYDAIDSKAESWMYVPKVNILSPLTIDKRWSKKKIVDFYNRRLAPGSKFKPGNLSNVLVGNLLKKIANHDRGI